jgi:steroid Delta-isomerase
MSRSSEPSTLSWTAPEAAHPARDASRRMIDTVMRDAKDEWLDLFSADAVLEDPVGRSHFDPEGGGHRGRDALFGFWDRAIDLAERFDFDIRDSFACGSECVNVGTITTSLPGGAKMDVEAVFCLGVDDTGQITSYRVFWESDRAMATLRQSE